jgi:23S rRNA (cytosine1962-C5)-methyltransferase
MITVTLKPEREKSLQRRHPWIFSGAIAAVKGEPASGETVQICARNGQPLALAAWSPRSQISAQIWSFDPREAIDAAFFRARIQRAVAARGELATAPQGACRLIYGASDGLPGLIVDRYDDWLVFQSLAAGAERWKDTLVDLLREEIPCRGIYERSDVDVRQKEGLPQTTGLRWGEELPRHIEIVEEGTRRLEVDPYEGHKTGYYLDQRENRSWLGRYAAGAEVLNAFSYTGGFSVAALQGGAARVTNLDSSAPALEQAARHIAINGLDEGRAEHLRGDAFQQLRAWQREGRGFDVVVLDPPRFVDNRASLPRASRGYKDINLQAAKLVRPGGYLFTFSCSGLMPADLFQKIVADALLDAGREGHLLRWLTQGPDHPVSASFPEAAYLKGLVCRVW